MRILVLLMIMTLVKTSQAQYASVESEDVFAEANESYEIPCETNNAVFTGGEELRYIAYYKLGFVWLKAGEIKFSVVENPSTYTLKARGFTYSSYSWLFKVDDYYETVIDKKTMKPLTSVKRLKEGGYRLYEKVKYKWDEGNAIISRGKTKKDTVTETMDIKSCIHDLLSVSYFLRVHDYSNLDQGERVPFSVFLNKNTYDLALKYEDIERRSVKKFGTYDTRRYSMETVAGKTFGEDGSKMKAFISNDKNKVPVFMESSVYVGTVKVLLKEAKNLKYPFEAQISAE